MIRTNFSIQEIDSIIGSAIDENRRICIQNMTRDPARAVEHLQERDHSYDVLTRLWLAFHSSYSTEI